MSLKIEIKTIPNSHHRYPTVGDYIENASGDRYIKVSEMGNVDYEFLVAVHELIEQHLCIKRGIDEKKISAFDIEFEKNRKDGDESEPGDARNAPYRKEHFVATNIERMLAAELGIDWNFYEETIMSL